MSLYTIYLFRIVIYLASCPCMYNYVYISTLYIMLLMLHFIMSLSINVSLYDPVYVLRC